MTAVLWWTVQDENRDKQRQGITMRAISCLLIFLTRRGILGSVQQIGTHKLLTVNLLYSIIKKLLYMSFCMKTNGGFLVTKIKQLGDRIFEKILSEKNIDAFNGAQGRILYVLWQKDGISIRSLSTKCGLAITSLTTMLERMENQGLISRVQSETDKRKTLLFLTEKAHALKGEYDSVSDEMGSIYYKGFSEEEITRFEECLDRIRKNLEEWQKS